MVRRRSPDSSWQDKDERVHATAGFGECVVMDKVHLRGLPQGVDFQGYDDLPCERRLGKSGL